MKIGFRCDFSLNRPTHHMRFGKPIEFGGGDGDPQTIISQRVYEGDAPPPAPVAPVTILPSTMIPPPTPVPRVARTTF